MGTPQDCSSFLLDRPLKEGERILAPTRRPDGTMRKPIRIRAGYTPQDEVAIYQSRGALFRRGISQVPVGYDPEEDLPQKPKSKTAKKNEKRKEKKHQQQVATSTSLLKDGDGTLSGGRLVQNVTIDLQLRGREDVEAVAHQMSSLTVSARTLNQSSTEEISPEKVDLEKRIRALRKKIRLTESLQASLTSTGTLNKEQAEKIAKLNIWHKELEELEAQKETS
eukprot:c24148_g1_i1 orf=243-911(+)